MSSVHPQFGDERVLAVLSKSQLASYEDYSLELPQVFPNCHIVSPADLEDLGRIVKRSHESHRVVLAIGGDGTLHQVLQHIDLEKQTLGLLPAGTGNDFARMLSFPERLRQRVQHLATLREKPTDFGTVNGLRYHNSAGFGLDSETLKKRESMTGNLRNNYTAVFLLTLKGLQCQPVELSFDAEKLAGRYYWVLCMNTPFIGGGTKIAPRALIDDGLLDMVLIRETSKLALLRYLPSAIKGTHLGSPMTVYRQLESLVCRAEQPIDVIAVDGELYDCNQDEVTFHVHSGAMRFLR